MNQLNKKILNNFSSQLGISPHELIRQSIACFIERKLTEINSEIFRLKGKYKIETIEEFENLYKTGEIEEEGTFRDYQKFDNLTYKAEQLKNFLSKFA